MSKWKYKKMSIGTMKLVFTVYSEHAILKFSKNQNDEREVY